MHWLTGRSAYARFHQNTPRDFVEIPSKMLEHFFYDANVIRWVSCHWEDPSKDIKVPEDAIEKLIATRYNNAASNELGNLVLAKFDMAVHTTWDPAEKDLSVLHNTIRRQFSLLQGPEDLGLGHNIFHGQTHARYIDAYGASYYSYLLWVNISHQRFLTPPPPLPLLKCYILQIPSSQCQDCPIGDAIFTQLLILHVNK